MHRVLARTTFALSASLLLVSAVQAADLDGSYLRGDVSAEGASAWDGLYVGVSISNNPSDINLAAGAKEVLAKEYRKTGHETIGELSTYADGINTSAEELAFGGYVGHNWTWDGVVMGVEASYDRTDLYFENADSAGRRYGMKFNGPSGNEVVGSFLLNYNGNARITDLVMLKGRLGYDAGPFMPFVTAGVALARGDSNWSSTVRITETDPGSATAVPPVPPIVLVDDTQTFQANNSNVFGVGITGGVGLDYMVTPGIILRGEYQITRIGNFDNAIFDMQSYKASVAAKF
jgi:outer membrane immunogenic protein